MLTRVIEIMVLLGACVAVIAVLRKPSWKTLVALPLGILLMLGIASVILAVVAPRPHFVQVPATATPVVVQDEWSSTQYGDSEAADQATQALIEAQRSQFRDVDRNLAQTAGWARLALLVGVALIIAAGVVTLLIVGRKWIARNAGVLFAIAGIGMVGLLAVGAPFVYHMRFMDVAEDFRRAEQVERLRAIGDALHHSSLGHTLLPVAPTEPDTSPIPTQVALAADDPAAVPSDAAGDASAAATPVEEAPATSESPAVELPDWITAFAKNPGDFSATGTTVLVSDQWATVQESEQQLEEEATLLLAARLRREHPEVRGWRPSNDIIHQSNAIAQRFVESTTLRVGEFESPMYRSYWQLQYTPGFESGAYSAWKQMAVEQRLWWLGGGTAGLTLLFALAAVALRIDGATGGRYRGRMTFAAVGLCTAAGAAVLMMA